MVREYPIRIVLLTLSAYNFVLTAGAAAVGASQAVGIFAAVASLCWVLAAVAGELREE